MMECFIPVMFVIGLCVGSFLNVVATRLLKNEAIVCGRSHCDHCKHILEWYELIPLFSWVIQRGNTRCCHKRLSIQHPVVELITGIGFVFIGNSFIQAISSLHFLLLIIHLCLSLIIFCSFVIIFLTDLKDQSIPMNIVYIGIGVALIRLFLMMINGGSFGSYTWSAFFGFVLFYFIWFISKGKAMGDGDAPLVLFMGLVGGFPKIIIALYVAFLTGAIAGVILILVRAKSIKSRIAFGPFLICGLAIAFLFEQQMLVFWNSLF